MLGDQIRPWEALGKSGNNHKNTDIRKLLHILFFKYVISKLEITDLIKEKEL